MPDVGGIHRAAVHDINDPEGRGRLRLLIPDALGDAVSAWAEPFIPTAETVSWSAGDKVWAFFEGGNLNRPVYVSRMEVRETDLGTGVTDVLDQVVPTEAPATSPALTVTGAPSSLIVRAETVEPTTLIEYHISTTSGFTPDTTTLLGEGTRATVLVVTHLPDETPLALDMTYYLRAVATNVVGDAAPSAEVTGDLDPSAIANIVAAELVAGFVLAGQIQVGNITIDPNTGITIPQPGGKSIVFPVDGSRARIEGPGADLDSLTVSGVTELKGNTTIGGTVTMNAGISAPSVPPTVSEGWPTLADYTFTNVYGLTESVDGTEWITAASGGPSGAGVYGINKTTGAVSAAKITGSCYGVARVGTEFFVFTKVTVGGVATHRITRYNSSWVQLSVIYEQPASLHNFYGIGSSSTHVLAAGKVSGGSNTVYRYTTTGTLASTRTLTGAIFGQAVTEGAFDFGTSRIIISETNTVNVHDSSTGARVEAEDWTMGEGGGRGIFWDGTRFWAIATTGKVYKHSTVLADQTVTASQTVAATSPTAAETAASPASTGVLRRKRAWIKVTASTPPTNPAGLFPKVYVGTAARYLQITDPGLDPTNFSGYVETLATTTTEPSAQTGTFGSGGTGELQPGATSGGVHQWGLVGDGSGKMGPFEWGNTGALTAKPWAAGVTTVSATANTWVSTSVTFPTAFSTTPVVVAGYNPAATLSGSNVHVRVAVQNVTTTGFTLWAWRDSSASTPISWHALIS